MGVESSHVPPGAPTCRVGTLSLIGYCLLSFLVCVGCLEVTNCYTGGVMQRTRPPLSIEMGAG